MLTQEKEQSKNKNAGSGRVEPSAGHPSVEVRSLAVATLPTRSRHKAAIGAAG